MSARYRTMFRRRWTCPWPDRVNKFCAIQGAFEWALPPDCRCVVRRSASLPKPRTESALAACREKLTCRAFGVPSCPGTGGPRPRLAACCNRTGTRRGATMPHTELKRMIDGVKDGRMDRRAFIARMIGLGLTAPMATQLLAVGGVAMAQSPSPDKPTRRGGGGALKLLWCQGPTLLN